ncbi:MAG: translation initiation factor IF-3, partial [Parcubacteria group bacterium CG_4_9_14_0_2_um_filter_35_11]
MIIIKTPRVNNQIRAKEVRLISEDGKNIGVLPLDKALQYARERNLDLIEITEKTIPPVCKAGDMGKYLYQQRKKEKRQTQ